MPVGQWLLLLIIGLLAGGFGVVVGAGGGFIIAPLLLVVFHLPPALVAGTSLAIVFLNTLSGSVAYARQQWVDYRVGLILSLPATPGALLGATAARLVSPILFRTSIGLILLGFAIYLVTRPIPRPRPVPRAIAVDDQPLPGSPAPDTLSRSERPVTGLAVVGLGLGFVSSFFGLGAGWLVVPILVHIYGFPPHMAAATSIFSLCVYSGAGVAAHLWQGHIVWPMVTASGLGVIVAGQIGASLSTSLQGTHR
ncbi:MAG: sulfite exporter TauE/SafE family protein, partial [Armatimonadetes bacterium]|nr:sulfite exporter TauE/SafE family protein [Armatimonadota bacterium]